MGKQRAREVIQDTGEMTPSQRKWSFTGNSRNRKREEDKEAEESHNTLGSALAKPAPGPVLD